MIGNPSTVTIGGMSTHLSDPERSEAKADEGIREGAREPVDERRELAAMMGNRAFSRTVQQSVAMRDPAVLPAAAKKQRRSNRPELVSPELEELWKATRAPGSRGGLLDALHMRSAMDPRTRALDADAREALIVQAAGWLVAKYPEDGRGAQGPKSHGFPAKSITAAGLEGILTESEPRDIDQKAEKALVTQLASLRGKLPLLTSPRLRGMTEAALAIDNISGYLRTIGLIGLTIDRELYREIEQHLASDMSQLVTVANAKRFRPGTARLHPFAEKTFDDTAMLMKLAVSEIMTTVLEIPDLAPNTTEQIDLMLLNHHNLMIDIRLPEIIEGVKDAETGYHT